ncbi:hypothetical protein [Archaeoglobus veneficus]|uniref:Uncharacterized protein n=1 Tax=Archaeoglobus veneficus (strain DSM 11195 / SNP6) TaxID=693661 RepID=F2KSH7_ARCVS|nr:hypothetical protein [Archaeoglobus veneficus]AEA48047.1 hypothetical protein Arcve_2057 [Archaeoglobus veneficus SNP6]
MQQRKKKSRRNICCPECGSPKVSKSYKVPGKCSCHNCNATFYLYKGVQEAGE